LHRKELVVNGDIKQQRTKRKHPAYCFGYLAVKVEIIDHSAGSVVTRDIFDKESFHATTRYAF
jgi:pterin-4a-carbinolamine dehydratase